ncbi:diaminopropionate ammonia-lyase [Trinickia symbiotica]|uniref:Diaminopropionate ammonia-lyase n=1 Tax=Trinickia symbiotica TaxID=863227 RepID=A0A2N7X5B2_9BURK|nr:diaminopropionate ammonia-lyase [Trinickia symbiotica]PMS36800.1 diaminopropionate ammonia-lyase [Trinickia symbiotica]PPK46253.1 diaminopropionate ammonia-lyase [Trinickia symbiotica]
MFVANRRAVRSSYPVELKEILSVEKAEESRRWISAWDGIAEGATPLYSLPGIARRLGVAEVLVKDESVRSELGSFKALGAPIALVRLILRLFPDAGMDPVSMFKGAYKDRLRDFTVISATDGNHGKGLAAAARSIGCKCVIVLHANVSVEREEAIAAYGAEIVRITGNYDESVEEAARLAKVNGWQVVSDTSYEGYEAIPRDVMQGYGTVAAEIVEAYGGKGDGKSPFTHVFLQGGVGGLAAGILSYLWEVFGENRPTVVVVEPKQADCLYQSAITGEAAKATGSVDSVMAGLACGETSPLAWRFLVKGADYFMTISDDDAVAAMKVLASGDVKDIPVISGESGAAGLAGLEVLDANADAWKAVGLNSNSCVLLISTEGATAPQVYKDLVGESAEDILKRQRAWPNPKAA